MKRVQRTPCGRMNCTLAVVILALWSACGSASKPGAHADDTIADGDGGVGLDTREELPTLIGHGTGGTDSQEPGVDAGADDGGASETSDDCMPSIFDESRFDESCFQ